MADKVVLYSYFRSSASWRVRIALAMKDIKYDYKAVHLVKSEQRSEDYKKLNPMGHVPSIMIDGHVLTQSLPIIEYLEERNPEPPLLPKDMYGRAQVRALAEVVNSGIQPIQNLSVLQKYGEGKEEWARFHIEKGFVALEAMLEATAGQYSYGDKVTIADLCLVPQIYNANRFKVDMSQFPIINRIHEALAKLPAFIAADPLQQPDCPEDLKAN